MKVLARVVLILWLASPLTRARAQSHDWDSAESDLSSIQAPAEGQDPGAVDPNADESGSAHEDSHAEAGDDSGDEPADESLFDTGDPEGGGQLALWAEVAFYAGGVERQGAQTDAIATSPLIGAAYSITSRARVSAQWGFTFASHNAIDVNGMQIESSDATFRMGNPLLSADLLGRHNALRYRVGVGVGLPLARSNNRTQDLGVGLAMAMRGGFHPWLWMPDRLSLVGTGRIEGDLGDSFVLGGDAALAILIGTASDANTNVALEVGGDAEYHAAGPLFIGLRLTMVLYADLAPGVSVIQDDNLQFALMPYARFLFGTSFVTAGFEINLDPPFGNSFSSGGVWGLRVGVGTVL